jgi:hypothetical protein
MRDLREGESLIRNRGKEAKIMMIAGVLLFAIVTFFLSFLIGRANDVDKGKAATTVTLVAWGSLLYGLYLSKGLH